MSKITTITITGVPDGVKEELTVACVRAGTTVSAALRRRIPGIIATLNGEPETPDEALLALEIENQELREKLWMLDRLTRLQTRALLYLGTEQMQELLERAKASLQKKGGEDD